MAQEFLSDSGGSVRPNSDAGEPEREKIEFMIMGSREGVMEEILKFYLDRRECPHHSGTPLGGGMKVGRGSDCTRSRDARRSQQ